MYKYYYGDVDEDGRLVEHVTVAVETDITPADMAVVRGIGSTVHVLATGKKWMYAPSGWVEDNTPEGGGGSGPEPHTLVHGGEMLAGSYLRMYKAPIEVLVYAINNGLVDTSTETNLGGLLAYAYDLVSAEDAPDLTKIDTSNATDLSYFLFSNGNIQTLDVSDIDTGAATKFDGMFEKCMYLRTINFGDWDTSHVTTASRMFFDCQLLQSLDLSGWDVSALENVGYMFYDTPTLRHIDLTGWHPVITGTGLVSAFDMCSVESLDLSGWDVSNATSMSNTFNACRHLTSLNLSGWDTSHVATFQNAFFGLDEMPIIDISALNTSEALTIGTMLGTRNGNPDTVTIKAPANDDRSKAKGASSMFAGASTTAPQYAQTIYAPKCRANNTFGMFRFCTHLTDLHLEGFDCHEATNANLMFGNCSALTNVYTDAQTVMPAINFSMTDCTALTEQSMVNIFGALPTVTAARTISLAAAAKARLTETDIAIATDKGWTIA